MKRWLGTALIILSLGALTSAFIVSRRSQLPTVPLGGGFVLRLTKIALGEKTIEPWENLPRKLASFFIPSKYKAHTSSARSLEIHLGKFDSAQSKFVAAKFSDPVVFFPNGRFSRGTLSSNVMRIEFSSYPRNEELLKIQLTEGERKIAFVIPNPHRAAKENWHPAPLPQTNSTGKINVVLQASGDPEAPFHLTSQSASSEPQAWTQWNIELHDAYGNWNRLQINGRRISAPDAPLMGDCFKLTARGKEYISAGRVAVPETNSVLKLTPTSRAINLGLGAAFLLGPGTYELKGSEARCTQVGQVAKTNSLAVADDAFEIQITLPSILLVQQESRLFLESISARLRERQQDERKSKYFHSRKGISATNQAAGVEAALFPISVSTTEKQLEAEIIAAHRPAEFFVSAKSSGPGK